LRKLLLKLPNVSLNAPRVISRIEKGIMLLMILMSLVAALAISPLGFPALTTRKIEINSHVQTLHDVLNLIPPSASVATQNDILPHLSQREEVTLFALPDNLTADSIDADYVLVDMKSTHFRQGPASIFGSPSAALSALVTYGTTKKKYGILVFEDDILLLKKNYNGTAIIKPFEDSFNYETLQVDSARAYIGFDPSSRSGQVIIYDLNHFSIDNDRNVWFGPYVYLFGEPDNTGWNYSATFRMKTKTENTLFVIDAFSLDEPSSIVCRNITSSDFKSMNEWQDFTIFFAVKGPQKWEFRGWAYTNNTYVALDYIDVKQIVP
jgi:hypothetical protein